MMNLKSRPSDRITRNQAINIRDAAYHALVLGLPLTVHVIVHLNCLDSDLRAQETVSEYLKRAGDWLSTRGVPRTHVWVLEAAPFEEERPFPGAHAHILLHVPEQLISSFKKGARHRRWLAAIGAWAIIMPESLKVVEVDGASPFHMRTYAHNLANLVRYLLKGTELRAAEDLGLAYDPERDDEKSAIRVHRPQGWVRGKRVATSENLTQTARNKYVGKHDPTRTSIPAGLVRASWGSPRWVAVVKSAGGMQWVR